MASGNDGHCPTHDLVSSSASHGGLEARIADVAATSPSRRSTCAEWRAACAAGAVSGAPVHAGSAASTATDVPRSGQRPRGGDRGADGDPADRDRFRPRCVVHRVAVAVDEPIRLRRRRDDNRAHAVQCGGKRPVDVVIVGSGARQKDRRHATQTDRHHTIVPGP